MSFPASPSNGQTAIINNIAYTYNSTSNTWTRNAVNGALAYFSGNGALIVGNTTPSTSSTTGALQVTGGIGAGGNISVGGSLLTTVVTTPSGSNSGITISPDGIGSVTLNTNTYVTYTTPATSPSSGAFVVTGGAGIGGNLYTGGSIFVTSNVAAGTSTRVEANVPHPFMLMGI